MLAKVDWSTGEPLQRLTTAVNDWLGKTGMVIAADPGISMKHFAAASSIPHETFRKYVCSDLGKRRVLGAAAGKAPLISHDTAEFTVSVMRRKDRANDGLNKSGSIDVIQDLLPGLKRKQVEQAFDRTVRPKYKAELTGIIKAQASTEKRSAITVPQQYRWHQAVDSAFTFLREKNEGTTPDGRTFGEVMPHFVLGGDETGLLASNGDVTVIGDKKKLKHEVSTAGSRVSITAYRCGSAAGSDGPTGFLPPGVRRKSGFTDEFLLKHGAAPGSTIVMTPSGYMTEDAWLEMAPTMARGIRKMPVICDNPSWWVVKIIDGFGPHTSSEKAMTIYAEQKIMLVKEEGDTSHVCQAYDQEVAKADKRSMRSSLAFLRSTTQLTKGVVDGWQLVHVALAMVRELAPETWVYSFRKVNLHPHRRVSFEEWCKRIAHFLQGGESFKPEVISDGYALLPSFWHGMTVEEKKMAASIFAAHGSSYTVDCLRELHRRSHIQMADMQNLRVCLELAAQDPTHLERGLPEASSVTPAPVAAAQAAVADVTEGLVSFQLHPKGQDGKQLLTGMAKFEHLVKMARRSVPVRQQLRPSRHLDVEMTPTQQQLLDPAPQDFAMHEIMRTCHGKGAKKAMAQRKIDALGNIRGACGFANDPVRLARLKNQLQLAESLADISKVADDEKATKRSAETSILITAAPDAIKRLIEKGGNIAQITIKDMDAIAFASFAGATLKGDKAAKGNMLLKLIMKQPTILEIPAPSYTSTNAAATLPTPTLPTPVLPTAALPPDIAWPDSV